MKWRRYVVVGLSLMIVVVIGCGTGDDDSDSGLDQYFPAGLVERGLQKVSETQTFVGDSLWEYINGGAELYHSFGFVRVTTADYKSPQTELVLDLYQFETSDGAYGLYAGLRPDEPELVAFGVEGYFTGSSLEFVKGDIMVRLVSYDASKVTASALKLLAGKLAADLPGTVEPPAAFGLFPRDNALTGSDKIVGEGFLGQGFLHMIYTRDYLVGSDTVTLFVADDPSGNMFAQWSEAPGPDHLDASGLPFDDNYYFVAPNSYYGNILVGLKNGRLVGMINYADQDQQFMSDWLLSLPTVL